MANDMAAWSWTDKWPWCWTELDEKIRRAESRKIERGFTYLISIRDHGWIFWKI